jgi:hypothetical protein
LNITFISSNIVKYNKINEVKAKIKMKGMRIVLPSRAPMKSSSPIYYPTISRELYPHLDPISFVQLRCPESPQIHQSINAGTKR